MRSSEFTDKQTTELPRSKSDDFLGFSNEREDDDDRAYSSNDDEIFSTFTFRPIRPVGSLQSRSSAARNFRPTDHIDLARAGGTKVGTSPDITALISLIDRKIKEHVVNVLHAVEGVSACISQLEARIRQVENSIDEFKDSIELNHGRTVGKLRELENVMREVQGCIQDLRDKQEISETKLQLAKLKISKDSQQSQNRNNLAQDNPIQGAPSSLPQQSHQTPPIHNSLPQYLPSSPILPPATSNQNSIPTPSPIISQHPSQLPHNQAPTHPRSESRYASCSPHMLTLEPAPLQYNLPSIHQPQRLTPIPNRTYLPANHLSPISQISQLPEPNQPLSQVNLQAQHHSSFHPQENHYMPAQSHNLGIHKSRNELGGVPLTQQFHVVSTRWMHDQPSSSHYSEFSGNSSADGVYYVGGSSSTYSNSIPRPSQLRVSDSASDGSGSSHSQSQMQTSQIPHAIPMALSVEGGSDSDQIRDKRMPSDDIVDKVVAMGFRRDLVKAVARKLTENGQSVDHNVVLDKLMNDGEVTHR